MPHWLTCTLLDIALGEPDLSTLTQLVVKADLTAALSTEFGLTVSLYAY